MEPVNDLEPEVRPIDKPLLVGFALAGALLGTLSSFGITVGIMETVGWVVIAGGGLIATMRRIPQDAFRHAAFGLTLAGFLSGDAKVLFWDRFLASHPDLVAAAQAQGAETIPRVSVIFSDTITGIIAGLIIGFLAKRLTQGRTPSTA